jgi:hypothetical protein
LKIYPLASSVTCRKPADPLTKLQRFTIQPIMKNHLSAVILTGMSLSFIACDHDTQTMPESEIRPIKMEEEGYKRELSYNNKGKLVAIKSTSVMPDNSFIVTTQKMEFDERGRIARTVIDDSWRMEYTYNGDRIVRTDEYRNSQPHQVHLFTYNGGRMVEMITVREDGNGITPVSKISNVYDLEGNVMESTNYIFENDRFELNMTFIYSGYDSMKSGEHHFGAHALNPLVKVHKNNPGKMVVKNFNGLVTSTEEYTYQYDMHNFPVLRYTTVTFPFNGNTGIYKSEYFYEAL